MLSQKVKSRSGALPLSRKDVYIVQQLWHTSSAHHLADTKRSTHDGSTSNSV